MFLRIDKLQAELPAPKRRDPNAAAALQELIGAEVTATIGAARANTAANAARAATGTDRTAVNSGGDVQVSGPLPIH